MTVRPVEPGRGEDRLVCPRDGGWMRRFDFSGTQVDRCVMCGGIWLDLGELRALLSSPVDARDELRALDGGHGPGEKPTTSGGGMGACPRDGAALTAVHDARQWHVEYDLCTHCGGVFLDAGELTDLSEFSLRERLRWMFPGLAGGSAGEPA